MHVFMQTHTKKCLKLLQLLIYITYFCLTYIHHSSSQKMYHQEHPCHLSKIAFCEEKKLQIFQSFCDSLKAPKRLVLSLIPSQWKFKMCHSKVHWIFLVRVKHLDVCFVKLYSVEHEIQMCLLYLMFWSKILQLNCVYENL